MRLQRKTVVSTETPKLATAKKTEKAPPAAKKTMPDNFDAEKGKQLMENTLRVDSGGERPPPRMGSPAGVQEFANAKRQTLAPGVDRHVLLDDPKDPSCTIDRVDVSAGQATPESRTKQDQRTLVWGSGTLTLNGVQQSVVPGDMVMMPKGTRFKFEADRGEPLKLWSVMSPDDAPMKLAAGVLSEDPKKEFFVGEGIFVLERANSANDPAVGYDRIRTPAGVTTALHKLTIDERYLVTKGGGEMELDGVKRQVQAGDVVQIPRGVSQRITAGEGGVEFYTVTTPRFIVDDYTHLGDAMVDPKRYDGSAGPLADVQAKLKSK